MPRKAERSDLIISFSVGTVLVLSSAYLLLESIHIAGWI